jgi:hypothetical protein
MVLYYVMSGPTESVLFRRSSLNNRKCIFAAFDNVSVSLNCLLVCTLTEIVLMFISYSEKLCFPYFSPRMFF